MASLKTHIRASRAKGNLTEDTCTDGVLELSVTVGYLGSDVKSGELGKLHRLLLDHCMAGLVALERGDLESHLHFQMVCQARCKSARSFGSLVPKYMDWAGVKNMSLAYKVTCKQLTIRLLHTWKGMIGYCLKDSGMPHFESVMHEISDEDVVAGKTLHSIYGKSDLKSRVVLTNKNVDDRAYVWYKYKENRQFTATMLSTLTDMINSALFIPSASWIIPITGLGMEQKRMNAFWKCLTDPTNVHRSEVADVFIRKREYVRGRYHDDHEEDDLTMPRANSGSDYVFQGKESDSKIVEPVVQNKKVEGAKIGVCTKRKLFEEPNFPHQPSKSVKFADCPVDFIPINDMAEFPRNIYLPTIDALHDSSFTFTPLTEVAFRNSLTKGGSVSVGSAVKTDIAALGGKDDCIVVPDRPSFDEEAVQKRIFIDLSSDYEEEPDIPSHNVIELSSDSEDCGVNLRPWLEGAAYAFLDRKPKQEAYSHGSNIISHVVKTEPEEYIHC